MEHDETVFSSILSGVSGTTSHRPPITDFSRLSHITPTRMLLNWIAQWVASSFPQEDTSYDGKGVELSSKHFPRDFVSVCSVLLRCFKLHAPTCL